MDHQNKLSMLSYNVRGLKDKTKRAGIFNWLQSKNSDILLLQETHCHLKKDETKWSGEWEGKCFWSKGTSRSKGVAILFKPGFKSDIVKVNTDSNGRYIIIYIKRGELIYRIVNIYAPNEEYERINFTNMMIQILSEDCNDNMETIIGGDYNCVLNSELDRKNCSSNYDAGQRDVKYLMDIFELEDVWRRRNPDERCFTWEGRGKQSRIDYWLISQSLDNQIDEVTINRAPFSDHSAICLVLHTDETMRGRGIWKMNVSILTNDVFRNAFFDKWAQLIKEKHLYSDIQTWWDIAKKGIKSLAMNVSTYLKRKENERVEELETKLNTMSNMDSHGNSAYIEISKIKEELFDIYTRRGEGSKIRSRVKWWEEGEKSTRYFHNLEKTRGKDKVWHRIKNKHGDLVFDPYEIQKCQVDFYKELYTANSAMNEDSKTDILKHLDKVLDERSKGKLDEDISMAEVIHALKKQKNNKSPGPDGIPVEFYKMYWHTVGEELLNVFHSGLDNRRLAHSQYLAVIKLLYKKGPREDIKNWRPICLLNADYKLLSKVLAERIKSVLPKIIHSDQKGGVDGRYIGENIRLIEDVLYEMENENSDAVILMLDMEKAFDRVEWGWLFKVLAHFNFGERFISWLMTIYQHAQCSILTNGIQSEYFPISRGIRQGDALSALLFVVQAEPFAQLIRTDTKIQGFKIDNGHGTTHIKACQYVDDTVTVLKNKSMIKHFFHLIERYGSVSGAKLNVSKTVGLVSHPDFIDNTLGIQMTIGPERLLGVPVGNKIQQNEFWIALVKKLRARLEVWKSRELTWEGKCYLIKSIGISQLAYAMEMKTMPEYVITMANQIFDDFLWKNGKRTINRDICTLPRELGGLGLTDISIISKVKKIMWIVRYLKADEKEHWVGISNKYMRCMDDELGMHLGSICVYDSSESLGAKNIPDFYKECIMAFQEFCRKARMRTVSDIIWFNDYLKFNGKPFIIKWYFKDKWFHKRRKDRWRNHFSKAGVQSWIRFRIK